MTASTLSLPGFSTMMGRAFRRACPACGRAHLFRAYLKQIDQCPACSERYAEIRADDGPAWLTVLLTGHLLAPFFGFAARSDWPDWALMTFWPGLALVMILLLLPVSKAFFIALLWRMQKKKEAGLDG